MATFDLKSITSALADSSTVSSGVDFSGKSLKLDSASDAQPIVDAIASCPDLQHLTLTGNTLGVAAAEAIAGALRTHPELKVARFSDMFTGRMKTEIPPALSALGEGMIAAGARLRVLDLSDNAFGPIGVEGLARLLQSDVCSQLEELRLNNNGLGITGGRLLAAALAARARALRVLAAGRNRLENDGARALARVFKDMGTLEELAMPQNGIYHVGISALSDAFKNNPNLSILNLNDNTIGAKGAAAVADALPKLKNLRSINFGDCLLKSKGASALAKALKNNATQLESLDLSHNEIGREACLELVEALAPAPGGARRLRRLVLAGNSLGGSANKRTMKEKLGECAELSGGEGSEDEYVTDSESEHESSQASSDDDDDDAQSNDDEDVTHVTPDTSDNGLTLIDTNITIEDTSVIEDLDAEKFLQNPTLDNLKRLGANPAEVLYAHIKCVRQSSAGDCSRRLAEACACCGALHARAAARLWAQLGRRPAPSEHALAALGLIKSEDKQYKIRWSLPENYALLATIIDGPDFSESLRDTLKFFIKSKMASLTPEVAAVVRQHPNLYS